MGLAGRCVLSDKCAGVGLAVGMGMGTCWGALVGSYVVEGHVLVGVE